MGLDYGRAHVDHEGMPAVGQSLGIGRATR